MCGSVVGWAVYIGRGVVGWDADDVKEVVLGVRERGGVMMIGGGVDAVAVGSAVYVGGGGCACVVGEDVISYAGGRTIPLAMSVGCRLVAGVVGRKVMAFP